MSQNSYSSVENINTFIERLQTEALSSLAVNHSYLKALVDGEFVDMNLLLKDFAYQYGLYSRQFTRYVSIVIKNLSSEKHKAILLDNLEEELGNAHEVDLPQRVLDTIIDQPHSLLFQRFQNAIGVDEVFLSNVFANNPGADWAKEFLELCKIDQYVGIGAIGIGTELIVSSIYKQVLNALKAHTDLTQEEHVFFDLHSECDDEHAEQIMLIANEIALTPDACEKIEYGASKALELRVAFWDAMLERGKQLSTSTNRIAV